MTRTYAVVPAAGRGLRMGMDRPKQFLQLLGEPIILHTLSILANVPSLAGIVLVVPEDFLQEAEALLREGSGKFHAPVWTVAGGAERQDSVSNALKRLPSDCEWVLIHDGVRPFVTAKLIEATLDAAARSSGAAIAAIPATDTIKRVTNGYVSETLPREAIWLVQTPQVFRKDILLEAYRRAREEAWMATDDASLVERIGIPVSVVLGERTNIKVTTREDLAWASVFLSTNKDSIKTKTGV